MASDDRLNIGMLKETGGSYCYLEFTGNSNILVYFLLYIPEKTRTMPQVIQLFAIIGSVMYPAKVM